MNKREKEILQAQLDSEKAVLKELEANYKDALEEINSKIEILLARQDADMQHVIYQVEYQKALKTQVQAILEQLHTKEFETISEYLASSYEEGFLSTMYELHEQGIPLIMPIDQEQVVEAIQHETKLSTRTNTKTGQLYASLGEDMKDLQKKVAGEISRGISSGMMYGEIARNIANVCRIPKNNAMRIARTEAHRIQNKATADAQYKAKEKGADIVKVWSSTLDGRTRKTHRKLDGQIRELEEPFEVDGKKAMRPGDFGKPEEDINCRCRCNSRARWLVAQPYTKWNEKAPVLISDDGTTQFSIVKAKNFEEFQRKYKQAVENADKSSTMISGGRILDPDSDEGQEFAEMYYKEVLAFSTDHKKIAKNTQKTESEILAIKDYLFKTDSFKPDCAIAQSWQRLMIGKDIKKHDYTLIEHELYEMQIKKDNPNISHVEAHTLATKKYNYQEEVDEFYGNLNKDKKE